MDKEKYMNRKICIWKNLLSEGLELKFTVFHFFSQKFDFPLTFQIEDKTIKFSNNFPQFLNIFWFDKMKLIGLFLIH